ncbi:MAG: class I SAM-dependent methyltransferase [Planctomycetes bacterium]|nr:class I SAM-dependent methyltransferase [Planctomycetota bacterium]
MPLFDGRGGWVGALRGALRGGVSRQRLRSWGDFYDGEVDEAYRRFHLALHAPYLEAIRSFRPERTLEAGCGTAIFSEALAGAGVRACALDLDAGVVASVCARVPLMRSLRGDLFRLPFASSSFDVSFSQGVLEHFAPARIRQALHEQLRVARAVVFSVPNLHYRWGEYGDEKLWSLPAWGGILRDLPVVRLEAYHRATLRRNFFIPRPIMTLGVLVRP